MTADPTPAPAPPPAASRRRLLLLGILLVAGVLRAARLDLMAFEMDEGAASLLAVRFAHTGLWPLLGVKTSLQFYNPPLFLYVLAPEFRLTTDARLAGLLFALLGTLAVYVVYRTGREFFSPAVGLLAAAMMAVSPAAVEYARRLWGHSLIAALAPLIFYFLLRWVVAGRAKAVFWLALLIAVAQQFHFSGALFWIPVALAFLLFRPHTDWVGFGLGLTLGLLGYLPMLIEEADTGFESFRIIGRAIVHGTGQEWRWSAAPLRYWFLAATDLGHNNFLQIKYDEFLAGIPLYRATRLLAGLAWVGGLAAWAVIACLRMYVVPTSMGNSSQEPTKAGTTCHLSGITNKLTAYSTLLLAWSLVPLAAFLALHVPVVAPYFLVVYPAPFLVIARLIVGAWRKVESARLPRRLRSSALGAIALLVAAWGIHQIGSTVFVRRLLDQYGAGWGSYVTYGTQREAMRFVVRHAPGRPVAVSEEHRPPGNLATRYWFHLWTFDPNPRPDERMRRYFVPREQAEYWYVIRNMNYLNRRPDLEAWFNRFPSRRFGPLIIHVIPRPGPWPNFE